MLTRDDAAGLDAIDPLSHWRDEFVVADPRLVYLDGNSLGMAPRRALDAVTAVMTDDWATGLIRSWDHWQDMPLRVGAALAPLLGADPGEVVVHDSTTINIHQLVHAALALRPGRRVIAVDPGDFPTDLYVVAGIAMATGCQVRHGFDELDDVALVVRSLVDYRTAEVADLAGETARAGAAGAVVLWDLSHAAGVLELDLHAAGVELAVGCSYKFLNGGPGAPAWSYVAEALHGQIEQPIWGWFAQRDQFAMAPTFDPRPDIGRLLLGTPGILALTAAQVGIETSAAAGIAAIAAKARALTGFGLALCDQWGLASPSPREATRRGGHLSVRHADAGAMTRRLIEREIITDFRQPDLIRVGCSPLTTRFVDVYDGIDAIRELAGL